MGSGSFVLREQRRQLIRIELELCAGERGWRGGRQDPAALEQGKGASEMPRVGARGRAEPDSWRGTS